MKVRLEFEKNMRYISHLELMKSFIKILKRSKLNVKYTQGYNPHIILSIANPLPVGICGKNEFADFEIIGDLDEDEILCAIKNASDDKTVPKKVYKDCIKDFNETTKAIYSIKIISSDEEKIIELLNNKELNVEKVSKGKTKVINLKEYIYDYGFSKKDEYLELDCILACGSQKNLNPMLISKAIKNENIDLKLFSPIRYDVLDSHDSDFRK